MKLLGHRGAADQVASLKHCDLQAARRQIGGADQTVVAATDVGRGQIVKAFVVLKPGHARTPDLAREIQGFVKRDIAPFKYPRAIEFLDALPRNPSGKVQRYLLRDDERGMP